MTRCATMRYMCRTAAQLLRLLRQLWSLSLWAPCPPNPNFFPLPHMPPCQPHTHLCLHLRKPGRAPAGVTGFLDKECSQLFCAFCPPGSAARVCWTLMWSASSRAKEEMATEEARVGEVPDSVPEVPLTLSESHHISQMASSGRKLWPRYPSFPFTSPDCLLPDCEEGLRKPG